MWALITGASSGIGRDMARVLSEMGYDLILVARRKTKLQALKKELNTNVECIVMDISTTFNCMELYQEVKDKASSVKDKVVDKSKEIYESGKETAGKLKDQWNDWYQSWKNE